MSTWKRNGKSIKDLVRGYKKEINELFIENEKLIQRSDELEKEIKERLSKHHENKPKEEIDHLKTSFINNISHEIRTPMNAIMGFSDLLHTNNFSEEDNRIFKSQIEWHSDSLLRMIDDLIDISLIEANQMKLELKDYNLNAILKELYKDIAVYIEKLNKVGVKLHLEITETMSIKIRTDKRRLKEILWNLIINAIKFTEKGLVEVGSKLIVNEFHPPVIQLYVKDTGIGIAKNDQNYVFNLFTQVENTHNYQNRGLGIGLTICKKLTGLMGGNIWLESAQNSGATFYLELPLVTP